MEQVPQTVFTPDESQGDLRRLGERLVAKYMDEVAPTVEPADVLGITGRIRIRTIGWASQGFRTNMALT